MIPSVSSLVGEQPNRIREMIRGKFGRKIRETFLVKHIFLFLLKGKLYYKFIIQFKGFFLSKLLSKINLHSFNPNFYFKLLN